MPCNFSPGTSAQRFAQNRTGGIKCVREPISAGARNVAEPSSRFHFRSKNGLLPVALRGRPTASFISGGSRPASMALLPKLNIMRLSAWWAVATAADLAEQVDRAAAEQWRAGIERRWETHWKPQLNGTTTHGRP